MYAMMLINEVSLGETFARCYDRPGQFRACVSLHSTPEKKKKKDTPSPPSPHPHGQSAPNRVKKA